LGFHGGDEYILDDRDNGVYAHKSEDNSKEKSNKGSSVFEVDNNWVARDYVPLVLLLTETFLFLTSMLITSLLFLTSILNLAFIA